ncbi:hypothetical protein ACI3LY_000827 [Candidozyma auris]|uniref:Uncharacterized protein n=1 Tax=Candidozyma auris TaxID=498019 RepID=A0A2H1A7B6_CANAR|nr:hypothetical_protein [[Candida] auris]KNE00535.2 hypothetical protein QG37_02567 [[Candida] auris]PIS58774.1 hypothetical protein B9J08_000227 [[Candida] auris]QEO20155.1 hypothetical_protein [[Candida] auris]GBL49872.1 hypothetical protein CAJCM15448_21460 [[Candida] auris]
MLLETIISFFYALWAFVKPFLWLIIVIVLACVAYLKRRELAEIAERLRNRRRWYNRMQQSSSFEQDLENGLSSGNFDISGNIGNDSRDGLDENAKAEIRRIMQRESLPFDEARLRYFRAELSRNGVASDGLPTDKRTVTFDRL